MSKADLDNLLENLQQRKHQVNEDLVHQFVDQIKPDDNLVRRLVNERWEARGLLIFTILVGSESMIYLLILYGHTM